ncbi:MAG: outer membrane protein assembly factor BamD [Hyphomicrobiales bacterium]|nr:outer membrane protein assembly factor BamD [Hyphomicrobiales bacterium]
MSFTSDNAGRRGHAWARPWLARLTALALLAPVLIGCDTLTSLWGGGEEQFEEPADKLYNEGLYLLNTKRDLRTAAKRFEEVDRQHPYSDWARRSLIMSAYTYYQAGMYDESINTARRYIQLHPGSPDAAYAQYLIGSCYFDQIRDVTRDQERTERAMAAFDELIRKYPNSEYAISAKRKINVGRDQLAGREMLVGRYYMERRDYAGAINRFKIVVTRYQTTRHVEEALLRLTEAYLSLGIVGEAQTSAAVLGHNFPDSRWYKDAYALVQQRGLKPSENRDSWISQAFRRLGGGSTG